MSGAVSVLFWQIRLFTPDTAFGILDFVLGLFRSPQNPDVRNRFFRFQTMTLIDREKRAEKRGDVGFASFESRVRRAGTQIKGPHTPIGP